MASATANLRHGTAADLVREPRTSAPTHPVRYLKAGEYLYQSGEPKEFAYRVEKGALAVFERRIGKPGLINVLAVHGDYVGLGCLATHTRDARAVVDSCVQPLTRIELAEAQERDPLLMQSQSEEIEREFEQLKSRLSDRMRSTPTECIAAFLVAVSRQNLNEGRNPQIISDTLKCGLVSDLLGIDIDTLEHALRELQAAGLIEPCASAGLLLKDLSALEAVADGHADARGAIVSVPSPAFSSASGWAACCP